MERFSGRSHIFWFLQIRDRYLYGFGRYFVKWGGFRDLECIPSFCSTPCESGRIAPDEKSALVDSRPWFQKEPRSRTGAGPLASMGRYKNRVYKKQRSQSRNLWLVFASCLCIFGRLGELGAIWHPAPPAPPGQCGGDVRAGGAP